MGSEAQYGTDLALDLALERGVESRSVVDLALVRRGSTQPGTASPSTADLLTVTGRDNLCQAVWLRLATPEGDLAHLGHKDFGSRLYLLLGRLQNRQTLALAEAYVRRALRRESRIDSIAQLRVSPDRLNTGSLRIELTVHPRGVDAPLSLDLSFPTSETPVG